MKRIRLTEEFFHDIAWFQVFLHQFNGVTRFGKPILDIRSSLYADAC